MKKIKRKAKQKKDRFDKVFQRFMIAKTIDITLLNDLCDKIDSLSKTIREDVWNEMMDKDVQEYEDRLRQDSNSRKTMVKK